MVKTLLLAVAAVTLIAAGKPEKSDAKSTQQQPQLQDQLNAASSSTAMAPAAAKMELSGELKSLDKANRSLVIAPESGSQESVKLADGATISKDGVTVGLDQLKEGDQVRASFDASKQATSLQVVSKKDSAPPKTKY